jgi:hypothetical protein
MSIPTVVTTTVPTISSLTNAATSVANATPSVVSAIPSVAGAASSVAGAASSVAGATSSLASSVNSLPPLPSMNSISNTASNVSSSILNAGSNIANSSTVNDMLDKGKESISFMTRLMSDIGNLFTFTGLHNLSHLILNIFIILILLKMMRKPEEPNPKLYLYGLYGSGFLFIILYILSYIFEEGGETLKRKKNYKVEDKSKNQTTSKSTLSTPPIIVN